MTYSKFQHCRNLRKEILTLERKKKENAIRKNYEKEKLTEQTLKEVQEEYKKVKNEIKDWLKNSPLAPAYKESCYDYYIKGATNKVNNIERELKRLLGEV